MSSSKSGGRDDSNEVGSGRRKVTPQKQGKPKIEPDKTEKNTPPTDSRGAVYKSSGKGYKGKHR